MTMTKFALSTNYIEDMKREHPVEILLPQTVFVTGCDNEGGIGKAIASSLMAKGHFVRESTKEDLDVRDDTSSEYLEDCSALVCAHGVTWLDWIEDAPAEKIREIVDVNLTGSILFTQAFIQANFHTPHKKYIISIGSMAAFNVLNASAAYCASKAGLAHYLKCIAWELAPKGFLVFGVHPSNTIDTPMQEETIQGIMRYRGIGRQAAQDYWASILPMQQWLTKKDIANLVVRLLSGELDYLSGSNIQMAGGQR